MGSMVKKFVMAVAAAAVPAMVVSAVPAHANGLTLTAAPQITDQGVWIGWVGGSGASWCTVTTDWLTSKAFQDDQGKGGVLMGSTPLWRASNYQVSCENGDEGFIGGVWY